MAEDESEAEEGTAEDDAEEPNQYGGDEGVDAVEQTERVDEDDDEP